MENPLIVETRSSEFQTPAQVRHRLLPNCKVSFFAAQACTEGLGALAGGRPLGGGVLWPLLLGPLPAAWRAGLGILRLLKSAGVRVEKVECRIAPVDSL